MQLTAIFLLAACLHVTASGRAQTVTYSGSNVPLTQVFAAVEQQTGYFVSYITDELRDTKPITVSAKDVSLDEFLHTALINQPLQFVIKGNTVFIRKKLKGANTSHPEFSIQTPPIKISGTIIGINNQPLAGATIRVKGKNVNTISDERGYFELNAEEGITLIISYVGFYEREFKVRNSEPARIELQQLNNMDTAEVIINTGYQKISSERFVGSYSMLDSANYHRRAGMNIMDRLDGNIAGVLFKKTSIDNSIQDNIQIRGISTINGNFLPLIVVDNFPYTYDLNTINPNDVENIVVLKDAAATSIWGSRAGNGVIVITTKKARFNQAPTISVQSNVLIQEKPRLKSYPLISSSDFIEAEKFFFEKDHYTPDLSNFNRPVVSPVVEILDKINKGIIDENTGLEEIEQMKVYNYQDEELKYVYKPQIAQQHTIGISGGSPLVSYRFSFGYIRNGATIQNSKGKDQFTINSLVSFKPFKKLEVTAGIGLNNSADRSLLIPAFPNYPYLQLKNQNGEVQAVPHRLRIGYVDTAGGGQLLDWHFRTLDEIRLADRMVESRLANLNLNVSYKVSKWLSAMVNAQFATSISRNRTLLSQETFEARNLINEITNLNTTDPYLRNPVPIGGILTTGYSTGITKNIRAGININHSWKAKHSIQSMMSADLSEVTLDAYSDGYYGYNSEIGSFAGNMDYANLYPFYGKDGTRRIVDLSSISPGTVARNISFLTNLSYSYKEKFTLYLDARRDGANIFGTNTNNKWKPLWSVGSSWLVSKESFFKINWLTNVRLRASYGYSGNQVNTVSGYTTIVYNLFPSRTGLTAATISDPPNPDLKWEEVNTANLGVDFSLRNKRISGAIDYFQKTSTDLIAPLLMPTTSGVTNAFVNNASLKGNGLDINLNARIIERQLNWVIGVNFSHAKAYVEKINYPKYLAMDFTQPGLNAAIGQNAYSFSSFLWGGLDPNTGDPIGILNGKDSKDYYSISNDSVKNQKLHGSSIPLYHGNVMNSLGWKQFSISFNITYRFNYSYRKPGLNYYDFFGGQTSLGLHEFAGRWQKPGDEQFSNIPSLIYPLEPAELFGRNNFYQNSEINVLRGDHIRLQDFRLQYAPKMKTSALVKQLNIYLYINNLNIILWRRDKSIYDPDFTGFVPPRNVSFGMNINL